MPHHRSCARWSTPASTARRTDVGSMTTAATNSTSYENITVERSGSHAVITLNRPRVLNALSHATLADIDRALDELSADETVRAVIITGSGERAFAAGADIAELQALESAQDGYEHSRSSHALLKKMHGLAVPIIMAINGYAL